MILLSLVKTQTTQTASSVGPDVARMDFTRARCGLDLGQNYVAVWEWDLNVTVSHSESYCAFQIVIIYNAQVTWTTLVFCSIQIGLLSGYTEESNTRASKW